jgi:hypothetical protein
MTYIGQDEELTIERGCFNCARFKKCHLIEGQRRNGINFMEILKDGAEDYRYGCCCTTYLAESEAREQVQFT